jgi:exosortase
MSTASVQAPGAAQASDPDEPDAETPPIPPHVAARIAVLGLAFIALHWDILRRLARFAWSDGDWSHAFLIPLFSGYLIYQQRERLCAVRPRPCWWGLGVMAGALGGYLAGIAVGSDMLKGYSMIAQLGGMVLLLAGPAVLGVVWLPIAYLAFAVKISPAWWAAATWRMQLVAAEGAVGLLGAVGLDAERIGEVIRLYDGLDVIGTLTVAEACSGMRLLVTFLALGVAVAYVWERPWWVRLSLTAAAATIALGVYILRVAVLSLLYLVDPAYSGGDFHTMIGMLMLIPALGLFPLVGRALRWLERPPGQNSVWPGPWNR